MEVLFQLLYILDTSFHLRFKLRHISPRQVSTRITDLLQRDVCTSLSAQSTELISKAFNLFFFILFRIIDNVLVPWDLPLKGPCLFGPVSRFLSQKRFDHWLLHFLSFKGLALFLIHFLVFLDFLLQNRLRLLWRDNSFFLVWTLVSLCLHILFYNIESIRDLVMHCRLWSFHRVKLDSRPKWLQEFLFQELVVMNSTLSLSIGQVLGRECNCYRRALNNLNISKWECFVFLDFAEVCCQVHLAWTNDHLLLTLWWLYH